MRLPERFEKLKPYEFRIIATLIGFVIGVLLLTIGFWKTLLLAIITLIGFAIGSYRDGTFYQTLNRLASAFGRR